MSKEEAPKVLYHVMRTPGGVLGGLKSSEYYLCRVAPDHEYFGYWTDPQVIAWEDPVTATKELALSCDRVVVSIDGVMVPMYTEPRGFSLLIDGK